MSASKKLDRLNFLNRKVKIKHSNNDYSGEVFFFSQKALILRCSGTRFEVFNAGDFENINI